MLVVDDRAGSRSNRAPCFCIAPEWGSLDGPRWTASGYCLGTRASTSGWPPPATAETTAPRCTAAIPLGASRTAASSWSAARGCRNRTSRARARRPACSGSPSPACRAEEGSNRRFPTYPWQSQSRSWRRSTALLLDASRGPGGLVAACEFGSVGARRCGAVQRWSTGRAWRASGIRWCGGVLGAANGAFHVARPDRSEIGAGKVDATPVVA
jgi:hypothetical protein